MIPYKDFILAGKACFTLTNQDGKHYTYRVISKDRNSAGQAQAPIYFVSLGISYDESIYVGILDEDLHLRITTKSRVRMDSPSASTLQLFLYAVSIGRESPIRFQHEGKCCVCARPLTHPESIEAGIGPECSGRGYTRVDDLSEFLPKDL